MINSQFSTSCENFTSSFQHTRVLGIGIASTQYYWVLGDFFGIVLTLPTATFPEIFNGFLLRSIL